jgi:hypothetical protein
MKKHAGSGLPQGILHKGTAPKPRGPHAGSGAPHVVHHGTKQPPRSQTSWHAAAARSQKRGS